MVQGVGKFYSPLWSECPLNTTLGKLNTLGSFREPPSIISFGLTYAVANERGRTAHVPKRLPSRRLSPLISQSPS